jgi:predicted RNA-binding Zn-ribbon protein involved in translation (DUF1610 family)
VTLWIERLHVWTYGGQQYTSTRQAACPFCGVMTIVELPEELRDETSREDGTTHVCTCCGHGFAQEAP